MFETLSKAPGDKILALMGEYAADPRPTKIDLGVGVYKDEKGVTPVMSAVRKAEQRILENEKTKTYLGIAGNKGFGAAVLDLALADSVDRAPRPYRPGSRWHRLALGFDAADQPRQARRPRSGSPTRPGPTTTRLPRIPVSRSKNTPISTPKPVASNSPKCWPRSISSARMTSSCCMAAATTRPAQI
jgi:hypothetical protein